MAARGSQAKRPPAPVAKEAAQQLSITLASPRGAAAALRPCIKIPLFSRAELMCARRAVHEREPTEEEVLVRHAPRRPAPVSARCRTGKRWEDSTSSALGGGTVKSRTKGLAGLAPRSAAKFRPSGLRRLAAGPRGPPRRARRRVA